MCSTDRSGAERSGRVKKTTPRGSGPRGRKRSRAGTTSYSSIQLRLYPAIQLSIQLHDYPAIQLSSYGSIQLSNYPTIQLTNDYPATNGPAARSATWGNRTPGVRETTERVTTTPMRHMLNESSSFGCTSPLRFKSVESVDNQIWRRESNPFRCLTMAVLDLRAAPEQIEPGCLVGRPALSGQAHARGEREVQACVSGFPAPFMELRRARLGHETRRKRSTRAGITQDFADHRNGWKRILGEQPHGPSLIGTRGGMCRGAFHDVDQRVKGRGATAPSAAERRGGSWSSRSRASPSQSEARRKLQASSSWVKQKNTKNLSWLRINAAVTVPT